MKNDLLLRAIRKEPVERFPVWLMRQAGRYMREYRDLRAREEDFLSFCKNVDLAVEVSLLPLKLLGVDAIIIFSDILVPLEALGVKVEFLEGEGPRLEWSGRISDLKKYDPEENAYVYEIIRRVKKAQDEVPVIGFAGAPFTLLSYLIEGRASRDFRKTKLFMWEREFDFKRLMEILTDVVLEYLSRQVEAGADAVQIFDSWTLHLSRQDYEEFVLPYVADLMQRLKERFDTPLIYFFRGSSSFVDLVRETEADVLSVDWSVDLSIEALKTEKTLQGNLEPAVLYAKEDTIKFKVLELLKSVPRKTGYIFNLGHGLAPDMDFEKVKLLIEWSDELTVGVEEMDSQHRKLIDMINTVHDLLNEGKRDEAREFFVREITRYLEEHLKAEEEFMKRINYPDFERHKLAHDNFRKVISECIPKIEEGDIKEFRSSVALCWSWLYSHILKFDKRYGEFYNKLNASP